MSDEQHETDAVVAFQKERGRRRIVSAAVLAALAVAGAGVWAFTRPSPCERLADGICHDVYLDDKTCEGLRTLFEETATEEVCVEQLEVLADLRGMTRENVDFGVPTSYLYLAILKTVIGEQRYQEASGFVERCAGEPDAPGCSD